MPTGGREAWPIGGREIRVIGGRGSWAIFGGGGGWLMVVGGNMTEVGCWLVAISREVVISEREAADDTLFSIVGSFGRVDDSGRWW